MRTKLWRILIIAAVAGLAFSAHADVTVDKSLPKYQQTKGVSGTLKSVGSDTMNNLMALWADGFRKMYPNVKVEIEGKGSATAPTALIAATADFGPMSRPMKEEEKDAFEKQFGYKPTEVKTSIDMLAVYVHKDCPLDSLTMQQVDAIFSKTRKAGFAKDITTWGELGLKGEWADKPISLYGRNAASGTYGYFKEHALAKGDFKPSVKEQPGSSSVVQGVASDKYAIGYSGIGYKTADVKALALSKDAASKPIPAEADYAYTGEYPLARFLMIYVNQKPGNQLDPLKREFLRYILSQEGQQDVLKDGFFPLPAKIVDRALATLWLNDQKADAGSAPAKAAPAAAKSSATPAAAAKAPARPAAPVKAAAKK